MNSMLQKTRGIEAYLDDILIIWTDQKVDMVFTRITPDSSYVLRGANSESKKYVIWAL